MSDIRYSVTVAGGGETISRSVTETVEGTTPRKITLPAGKAGVLTTRTDNETGSLTLGSGHGVVTGAIVDLYWSGGSRTGITVGTVSGTTVPIGEDNSGEGDNLPIATTAIVCTPQVEIDCPIDGDAVAIVAIEMSQASSGSTAKGHIDFWDVGDASVAEVDLDANVPQVWYIARGADNPFTGNPIVKAFASNGDSAASATLKIIAGGDATP